ncbi:MAG: IS481 family transposase [Proteobacteria bacterium]|nr:IS481 family transposase [Pseudomonadota bacterium]MCH8098058.1 IS481 family transposase [Pseudomonadota bacterium]
MNVHKNARLTPRGRELLISRLKRGEHPQDVATAMGVSASTVYKWRRRHRAEGVGGLRDRSSRPNASPARTADGIEARVVALRKERRIYHRIAAETGVSRATVGRILTRHGLNRWRDLDPAEPVRRYERARPGEMIHIDIKKLGRFNQPGHRITGDRSGQSNSRGVGWEYVHVCIDDHSRLGCADVMLDEKKESAVAFLQAAVAWYARFDITVERVMTDNGSCYRSYAFRDACKRLGLKHIRTKPYTPKTNGKAERFIQSSLREWAYARAYRTSDQRKQELPYWLHHYNWHRPHAGIKGKTPISRSGLDVNNVMRLHI